MPTLIILITIVFYGAALYLWLQQRSYRYTIALIGGHLTVLLEPVWQRLYNYVYGISTSIILWEHQIPMYMVVGASWIITAPALGLFFAQRQRWWPRHYAAGILAYIGLCFYHLLVLSIGRSARLWQFTEQAQGWGNDYVIFLALFGGLVSLFILYALVATRYYAAEMGVPVLLGSIFGAPILVYGLLGAPFWVAMIIDTSPLFLRVAVVVTLLLLAWGVHLACWGLHASRQQQVRWS